MKIKEIASCTIAILILTLSGCSTRSHGFTARARWRAVGSTLDQNLAAARELCPVGPTVSAARELLGMDGRIARFHGVKVRIDRRKEGFAPQDVGTYDFQALEYEVPGGKIVLVLEWEPGSDKSAVVKTITQMKEVPGTDSNAPKP